MQPFVTHYMPLATSLNVCFLKKGCVTSNGWDCSFAGCEIYPIFASARPNGPKYTNGPPHLPDPIYCFLHNSFHKQKLKEAEAIFRPRLLGYLSTGLEEVTGKRQLQVKAEKRKYRKQTGGQGLTYTRLIILRVSIMTFNLHRKVTLIKHVFGQNWFWI